MIFAAFSAPTPLRRRPTMTVSSFRHWRLHRHFFAQLRCRLLPLLMLATLFLPPFRRLRAIIDFTLIRAPPLSHCAAPAMPRDGAHAASVGVAAPPAPPPVTQRRRCCYDDSLCAASLPNMRPHAPQKTTKCPAHYVAAMLRRAPVRFAARFDASESACPRGELTAPRRLRRCAVAARSATR
jgi:hypothetical protein